MHGTPIIVAAEKQGITPQQIADKYHAEYLANFAALGFSHDNYTRTDTATHRAVVQQIVETLFDKGLIYPKTQELPYCEKCKAFRADRYIEGECPHCHFLQARGDQCDNCGKLLDAKELINPRCKVCGSTPVWRETEHLFFKLSAFQKQLEEWVASAKGWRPNATTFTANFLKEGLHDRAITRNTEWGVPLPERIPLDDKEHKRIYVWFEAVCGYLSASQEWAEKTSKPKEWEGFWFDNPYHPEDFPVHYYVHGKDNIPFHTVIWPAILLGNGDLHLPDRIVSSEYLSLEKKKISTSRDWAVWLPDFLKNFEADALRYYLVANGPETADAEFTWKEFQARTNNELIANFGNFVNRTLTLIQKNFPDGVVVPSELNETEQQLVKFVSDGFRVVGSAIESLEFRKALQAVLRVSEAGNRFLNQTEPWQSIKTDRDKAARSLAISVLVIRSLANLIEPFLPHAGVAIRESIGESVVQWAPSTVQKTVITTVKPLFHKITDEEITRELEKLNHA